MELAEATMWVVVVSAVLIPLSYYFWRRWDRPSRAARAEQERRLQEKEVYEAFLKEEEKARDFERVQALKALEEKKRQDALPPSGESLSTALSSIVDEPNQESPVGSNEVVRTAEEVAELESIPESVEVPDIEPDETAQEVLEDTGPIPLKVGITLPEGMGATSTHDSVNITEEVEWPEWD